MAARARKIPTSSAQEWANYWEWNMPKLRKEMKRRRLAYKSTKKSDLVRLHTNAVNTKMGTL